MTEQQPEPAQSIEPASRWLVWVGLAGILMTVTGALLAWVMTPGRMERACGLIREGMTSEEADHLLSPLDSRPLVSTSGEWKHCRVQWYGDDGSVSVDYYGNIVERAQFHPKKGSWSADGVRSRLRSWLGWRR